MATVKVELDMFVCLAKQILNGYLTQTLPTLHWMDFQPLGAINIFLWRPCWKHFVSSLDIDFFYYLCTLKLWHRHMLYSVSFSTLYCLRVHYSIYVQEIWAILWTKCLLLNQADFHRKLDSINTPAIVYVVVNRCWLTESCCLLLPANQMSEFTSAVETLEH